MFKRLIERYIDEYIRGNSKKIFFLWGPRRSGKTTLLKLFSEKLGVPRFNFDLFSDQEKFAPESQALSKIAKEHKVILIDEVQNYPESTRSFKILHDEFGLKIIATGSSELRQKSTHFESLAGRFTEYFCLPFSLEEIKNHEKPKAYEKKGFLRSVQDTIQIFGAYPEVYTHPGREEERIDLLENIIDTYVLKDIITIYNLGNAKLAKDILTKIALQLGYEVSIRELANSLGANAVTVSHYIEIFIKNYILVSLPSFKTNARRAVSRHRKLYFLDLGIRNALVKDFRPFDLRPDKGGVFENFIVSEIYKRILTHRLHYSMYFYREYGGKEVDIVLEDYQKQYRCFEVKYRAALEKRVFPLLHDFFSIDSQNYFDVIQSLE